MSEAVIGRSVPRLDGWAKVTRRALPERVWRALRALRKREGLVGAPGAAGSGRRGRRPAPKEAR